MSFDYSKKGDVVRALAKKADVTNKVAEDVLNAYQDIVKESLREENPVRIIGFGEFFVRDRAARQGRNPQTGEAITIPAGKTYGFKMSDAFKRSIEG